MQLNSLLLLANLEDVLKTIVPIIFLVLWGVGQLLAGKEEAKRAGKAKPVRRPAPPQPPAGAGAPNQADALRREVEQFLRRAQGQPEPPQKQAAVPVRPVAQQPRQPAAKPRGDRQRPMRPMPQAAPSPPRQPLAQTMREEGVAEHVSRHMGKSRAIGEHAEQLGQAVALADEKTESRLHEKFDHQLGALQRKTKAAKQSDQTSIAQELREMLSRPEGMRLAIVASEILRRPVDRW